MKSVKIDLTGRRKYSPNDIVWMMHNNKPMECRIWRSHLSVDEQEGKNITIVETHNVVPVDTTIAYTQNPIHVEKLFESKEELLKSL